MTEVATMQLLESELAPDSVLPAQLYGAPFGGARLQPEKRLQLAVLADAVLTFYRGVSRSRPVSAFTEVEAWFASDDTDGPFTFLTICHSLGLDAGYIRRGLRNWDPRLVAMGTKRRLRRESNEMRHLVVLPRLRRVA
jgi:hypothetical protein